MNYLGHKFFQSWICTLAITKYEPIHKTLPRQSFALMKATMNSLSCLWKCADNFSKSNEWGILVLSSSIYSCVFFITSWFIVGLGKDIWIIYPPPCRYYHNISSLLRNQSLASINHKWSIWGTWFPKIRFPHIWKKVLLCLQGLLPQHWRACEAFWDSQVTTKGLFEITKKLINLLLCSYKKINF